MPLDELSTWEYFVLVVLHHPAAGSLLFALLCFMLTWLVPRPWFKQSGTRFQVHFTRTVGFMGALLIATTVLVTGVSQIVWPLYMLEEDFGWLYRSGPLLATALAVLLAALLLRRSSRNEMASRNVSPYYSWHSFVPRSILWLSAALVVVIAAIAIWQGSIPGNPRELPVLTSLDPDEMRYIGGGAIAPESAFSWATNAPVLVTLTVLVVVCVWAFNMNASRTAVSWRERNVTARLLSLITFCGLLLGLGMVLVNVWVPAEWTAQVEESDGLGGWYLGSHKTGLKIFAHQLGWSIQGIGLALLARIALEAARATKKVRQASVEESSFTLHGQVEERR